MGSSKKIVLLGHFGVGKSSLFRRIIDNEFSEDYQVTLGVQIKQKTITLENGETTTLVLWDTEGHEDISKTRNSYLLGAHVFVYIFDLSRKNTYLNCNESISHLNKQYPNIPVKLIGNKLDQVNEKVIHKILKDLSIFCDCYTSAKTSKNINIFLEQVVKEIS